MNKDVQKRYNLVKSVSLSVYRDKMMYSFEERFLEEDIHNSIESIKQYLGLNGMENVIIENPEVIQSGSRFYLPKYIHGFWLKEWDAFNDGDYVVVILFGDGAFFDTNILVERINNVEALECLVVSIEA